MAGAAFGILIYSLLATYTVTPESDDSNCIVYHDVTYMLRLLCICWAFTLLISVMLVDLPSKIIKKDDLETLRKALLNEVPE